MRTRKKWILVVGGAAILAPAAQAGFSPEEKLAIQAFWNRPGCYRVSEDYRQGAPYQARQTADGSRWLWMYDATRGVGKGSGTVRRASSVDPRWEPWVTARLAYDYATAADRAADDNLQLRGGVREPVTIPPDPGPMPSSLAEYLPSPPLFAESAVPTIYRVSFEDAVSDIDPASASAPGQVYEYTDRVRLKPRNAYFRFPNGVMRAGLPVKSLEPDYLAGLISRAGLSDTEARVMRAVSILEGGFESVNTYDTGFLSVGLIQFAALSTGSGSLGAVLRRLRDDNFEAFQKDFRQYGIGVTDERLLVAIDLKTGEEKLGPDAVATIIDDKRLTAVFQRAGECCEAFRLAQLRVAKDWYFPASDAVSFQLGGQKQTAKVSDVVRSEAGLATLMEIKVHKGGFPALGATLSAVASEFGAQSVEQLATLEEEVVRRMKDRLDFLKDPTLSQPLPIARSGLTSRHGTRGGRRGGG